MFLRRSVRVRAAAIITALAAALAVTDAGGILGDRGAAPCSPDGARVSDAGTSVPCASVHARATRAAGPSATPTRRNTGIAQCPALRPARGRTVTRDGTVLQNLDVTGEITIRASNVTVRCVRVRSTDLRGIFVDDGRNILLDRVEVDCRSAAHNDGGVVGSDYSLRRANIHHCEDGAKVGHNVVVERSWIHHLNTASPGAHYDGLQLMGCACFPGGTLRNVVIRHNNIEPRPPRAPGASSGATSAILIQSAFGKVDGVTVESNRLNCGAYTVYSRNAGHGAPTNVRFVNNRFGRCYEFGVRSFDGHPSWSGNVWEDTKRRVR